MEISNASIEWDSQDQLNLAAWLNTVTGKRFVAKLAESAPRLLEAGETNTIMIRNGMLLGFQSAIQTALDLAVPVQPQSPTPVYGEYPPLDDDEAWGDIPKN